jgi:hypothetical protein
MDFWGAVAEGDGWVIDPPLQCVSTRLTIGARAGQMVKQL